METTEIVQLVVSLIDSLGTIGILVAAWIFERRRADSTMNEIVADWKRQNDRETLESKKP